jgi:hypothetical protein
MSNTHAVADVAGGCLCGAVRYRARAVRRELVQCHCGACRRVSGGAWLATHALREDVTFETDAGLAWYQSSPSARRGFCRACGSSLFMDNAARPTMAILAGSVDQPSGLELVAHIFTADAADYDRFHEGVRQVPDGRHGLVYP